MIVVSTTINEEDAMNTGSQPIDVVRAFNAAMAKMDFDRAVAYVSDDCEYMNGPLGTVTGPEGIKAMLQPFFAAISENEWIIKREAVNGHVVFMERLDRHLLATGWIELPVTGVYEVRDGRISVWHDYFDLATIQRQMPTAA
jgi:limonene-1,2-epoxide hydrolase